MKIRALFLAANPKNLAKLNLEREVDTIREKLLDSELDDRFEIVPHWATKPDDLIRLLNEDNDWQIIHYSGHGSKKHEILLLDENGESKPVSKEALRSFFQLLGRKARIAIFNACYAEGQAEAVTEAVDCSIGMSVPVSDTAAIVFSASFYRALAFGKSFQEAFDQGCLAIEFEGLDEKDTPRLLLKKGVDASDTYLPVGAEDFRVEDAWTKHAPPPPELREGQDWHAFLSYRSSDRPWVLNLNDVLVRRGYKTFMEQASIQVQSSPAQRIEEGLSKSRTGILIWSEASAESEWCKKEYEAMQQRAVDDPNFTLVALQLSGELPPAAKNEIRLDFSEHQDGPNGGELLGLLLALAGKKPSPETVRFAAEQEKEARKAETAIKAALDLGDAETLLSMFETGGVVWDTSAVLGSSVGEALTKLEAYDQAIRVLEEVRRSFPHSLRPKQLVALAHARRGKEDDLKEAQMILAMLRAEDHRDPETLGIFGRTWMDRYKSSGKRTDLRKSRKLYAEAFENAPGDTYTGINAAAKSVFLDELDKGKEYARRVLDYLEVNKPADYWEAATIPEAHLILGDYGLALRGYESAVSSFGEETGSIRSTRDQAALLQSKLEVSPEDWTPIQSFFTDVLGEN